MYGDEKVVKEPCRKQELGYRYYHLSTVTLPSSECLGIHGFSRRLKIYEDVASRSASWMRLENRIRPAATVYHSINHKLPALFKRYFDLVLSGNSWHVGRYVQVNPFPDGWRLLRRKLAVGDGNGGRTSARSVRSSRYCQVCGLMLGKNERLLPLSHKTKDEWLRLFN